MHKVLFTARRQWAPGCAWAAKERRHHPDRFDENVTSPRASSTPRDAPASAEPPWSCSIKAHMGKTGARSGGSHSCGAIVEPSFND